MNALFNIIISKLYMLRDKPKEESIDPASNKQ